MPNLAIYIHFPFCIRRCLYCDFNTFAGMESYIPDYISSLSRELDSYSKEAQDWKITSIYFGGGTPSLIRINDLDELLKKVKSEFQVDPQVEITLEANPGTIDREFLQGALSAGINRLSLGIQSLDERELPMLGRIHSVEQAQKAVMDARHAGFSNISIDLIYGLPGQQVQEFKKSLEKVIELEPDHISLYALTLDEHVPMAELIKRGKLPVIDNDLAADMYDWATEFLESSGFSQYEISNWAKVSETQDYRSKHNLQYWHNLPYLGLGAGAHGFFKHYRTENVKSIDQFIDQLTASESKRFPDFKQITAKTPIDRWEEVQETMMLGLRLTVEGVDLDACQIRYGFDPLEIFNPQISKLEKKGLVEIVKDAGRRLRLTKRARLLGNIVFREFIGNPSPEGFDL